MLDSTICSFIMREQPEVVIRWLKQAVLRNHRTIVSAITCTEMRFGAMGKNSPRHIELVDAFCSYLDAFLLPWTRTTGMQPRR